MGIGTGVKKVVLLRSGPLPKNTVSVPVFLAYLKQYVQTNGSLHPQQNPLPDHAATHLGTQTEYQRKFKKEENKQHFIL